MNIVVRTHAAYGHNSRDLNTVLSNLRVELQNIIFEMYALTIGKQRLVHLDERYDYDFDADIELTVTIVLGAQRATTTELTKLCKELRRRLRKLYKPNEVTLKIVAMVSPIGMSVDRE